MESWSCADASALRKATGLPCRGQVEAPEGKVTWGPIRVFSAARPAARWGFSAGALARSARLRRRP